MKDLPYVLEIYTPGGYETVLAYFESDRPLPTMSVGELIDPRVFNDPGPSPEKLLRIVSVVHIPLTFNDQYKHKIMVFTEAVPNTPETLLGG